MLHDSLAWHNLLAAGKSGYLLRVTREDGEARARMGRGMAVVQIALLAVCATLYPRDAGGRSAASCIPLSTPSSSMLLGVRLGCPTMNTLRMRGGMGDSAEVELAGEKELPTLSAELRARVEAAVPGHWKVRTPSETSPSESPALPSARPCSFSPHRLRICTTDLEWRLENSPSTRLRQS